jgi:DNA-binding ferritin-like protein (Dps family)
MSEKSLLLSDIINDDVARCSKVLSDSDKKYLQKCHQKFRDGMGSALNSASNPFLG